MPIPKRAGRSALSRQRGSILLVIFALIGVLFLGVALLTGSWAYEVHEQWPRAEATVRESRLTLAAPETYSAQIVLDYSVGPQNYAISLEPPFSSSRQSEMQAYLERFAPGSRHRLPYDPDHPDVLSLDSDWRFESILLPLVFLVLGLLFIGIGLLPWLWKRLKPRSLPGPALALPALGERWPQWLGAGFALLGLVLLGVCTWGGVARGQAAQWPTAQAEILASRSFSYTRSKSGTWHAAELHLRYQAGGRDYQALSTADSSTRDEAWLRQALATTYAPGQRIQLRYNPASPSDTRFSDGDFTWFWILLFIGLMFTGMGTMVLVVFRKA